MRRVLASILIGLIASGASANPIALVLANSEAAPEVSDSSASNVHEAAGEPAAAGELDAAGLGKIGGRLAAIALAYETFQDSLHFDSDVRVIVDSASPRGLIPNPADRAQTLDRVYRALALLDDTMALRYPEGDACARAHRLSLLRSPDGLFVDPKTGELTPWLKTELKRSKANETPGGLVEASARAWTPLGYLKSLTEVRTLSLLLADGTMLGASRAAAFCRRAKAYGELAAAQTAFKWSNPDLSAQAKAVVAVQWGKDKGTGTVLLIDGKTFVLVSGRLTENAYETPDVFAKSGRRLSAAYARRGPALSLLSLEPSADVAPLALPENPQQGERVAYAVGHPIQGGPWSVTRGLAQPGGSLIRADAVVDGAQAGGPLFDDQGRLTGIVAGQGTAYDLEAIKRWLADETATLSEAPAAQELGTGALLTASSTLAPKERGGLIEASTIVAPEGVCVLHCETPSLPQSGALDRSAPYTGPNLWSMLGKLLKSAPKKEYKLEDNRPSLAAPVAPPAVPEPPKPPPDPLKPSSLKLSVSRTTLAQGEEFEAVATVAFTGKEGSVAGRGVSFTVTPGGKISCPSAATDGSGIARTTCIALEDGGRDQRFDALQDETRRRLGMKTPGSIRRKPAKGDKIAAMKEREASALGALDSEEAKHPEFGNKGSDTPGIDRAFPETEIIELEIKGDRVALGASIERLRDRLDLVILERPCPRGMGISKPGVPAVKQPSSGRFPCIQTDQGVASPGGEKSRDSFASEEPKEGEGNGEPASDTDKPAAERPKDIRTPATGQPGTIVSFPDGKGGRTDRTYGPDGRAIKDIDHGHDHGVGDPHTHDWDWDHENPRGPGRPMKSGDEK